jgi:hypothetical protein
MKILKTTSLKSDFKFRVKKEVKRDRRDLVHPRIQTKSSNSLGIRKLQTH